VEVFLLDCLENRYCAICGQPQADIHHVKAIGMGRNRRKVDDSQYPKISLCRKHHSEAHNSGWQTFSEKYHVRGIICNR
jgi:hypothetical protein